MTAFLIQLSQYWNTLVTVTWWSKRATVSVVWFCVLWLATILLLEIFLNRRFPFPVRCLLGTLVIAGVILTAMLVISLQSEKPWLTLGYDEVGYLIITYTICLLIGSIVLMINKERRHEKEIEMLRIENLSSQYNAIANQISPHFFFNALSNLSSLVRGDKKQESLEYIGNLSGIFRYIIRFKESSLTTLGEELNFINSYKQLMDVRFAESYTCEVDIPQQALKAGAAVGFAADGFILVSFHHIQPQPHGQFPAGFDLLFNGCFPLVMGRIPGVNRRPAMAGIWLLLFHGITFWVCNPARKVVQYDCRVDCIQFCGQADL